MHEHSLKHLDPRAPLVLDTRDLPRRPGAMRVIQRTVHAPSDLGLDLIGVPEGADLTLDLRLESVTEGVLVSGTVAGPVEGECGRCLRPVTDAVRVSLQELYAYEDSTTEETTEEDEVGRLQGDLLDLEPALRDAVVLALPNHPRCPLLGSVLLLPHRRPQLQQQRPLGQRQRLVRLRGIAYTSRPT